MEDPVVLCNHQWEVQASLDGYEPYMNCVRCEMQHGARDLEAILQHVQDCAPESIAEALRKDEDA